MLTLMAENVYVSEVYDTARKTITEDDMVATSFMVWVAPEEMESISTASCVRWDTDVFENGIKALVACFAGCRARLFFDKVLIIFD